MVNNRIISAASFVIGILILFVFCENEPVEDERVSKLAEVLRNKGWIAYSARSENGTWDIFLSRPDGTQRRNITNTSKYEEAAPLFSPDGKKMFYRRLAEGTTIDHDKWGFQGQLIIVNSDGTNLKVFGKEREYGWATWSPDGKQISCLYPSGIKIVDLDTKEVVRRIPRQGIYQSLYWSPDGDWFCGVANLGENWTIARLNAHTGELNAVHKFQSCTPDWFPDSRHIIFSSRPGNQKGYGWTQLWMAEGEGKNPQLIYGEDGYHVYGGVLSPDGEYVMFTKCEKDGGGSEKSGAAVCIMRFSDSPTVGGESRNLRKIHPNTKDGPVLCLSKGWEPCWTYAGIGEGK